MKIFVLNGSPRLRGNTKTALNTIISGINKNCPDIDVELCDVTTKRLSGCINCNGCRRNGGQCVLPDDSKEIINKIYNADVVIFGTPVYWWGVSSQLKMVIDKMYSKNSKFKDQHKKVAVVAVGANDIEDPQYKLIFDQMDYICDYLAWKVILHYPISAYELNDLSNNADELKKLNNLWKLIS